MTPTAVARNVTQSTTTGYRPGACNIGPRERRRRYRLAAGAFLVAAAYLLVVAVSGVPAVFVFGAFVPLSLGCEWCLQGRQSFCATLGFAGRYAFADRAGEVTDEAARRVDRRYAFRLTLLGLLTGAGLSLATYAMVSLL
jgi:hypothetical protein